MTTNNRVFSSPVARALETRLGAPASVVTANQGFLSELPGVWSGRGFNVIARPDKQGGRPFFLQVNTTTETIEFQSVAGAVMNRGSVQDDIAITAITYLQRVADLTTHAGLHVEPGIWLNVPSTTDPTQGATLVRQATIPHGDSLIAQSTAAFVAPAPVFSAVDCTPFNANQPIPDLAQPNPPLQAPLGYLDPFLTTELPPGLPAGLDAAATIKNPNLILEADTQGQNITSTIVVQISTAATVDNVAGAALAGGIVNIPFVTTNANAIQMDAIFWIETVQLADGSSFLQLQYVQRVILDFLGIHWPHISVATLVKQ
jgi:hypothetical protein